MEIPKLWFWFNQEVPQSLRSCQRKNHEMFPDLVSVLICHPFETICGEFARMKCLQNRL